jgi:hypothetical protein
MKRFLTDLISVPTFQYLIILSLILFIPVFRHLRKLIRQVEHHIAGQGIAHGFCPTLTVDDNLRVRQLMEYVESLKIGNQLAFAE